MAHAQHTPAPWRLNAGNETLVMGSNQRPIARAECGGTAGIGLAEAEANARLIAAAPELLEALKEMRDWYQKYIGLPACAANAAIAKATGE